MTKKLQIAPMPTSPTKEVPDTFEVLVFHADGGVSIQTKREIYYFGDRLFAAACALARMLKDRSPMLPESCPDNRINTSGDLSGLCTVTLEQIEDTYDADKVTSNHPGVESFFGMFIEMIALLDCP